MIKSNLIVAATALALVACATPRGGTNTQDFPALDSDPGFDIAIFPAPAACLVRVYVVNDQIVIDHEPVYTRGCSNGIRWRLDSGRSYMFDSVQGIRFKGHLLPANLRCPMGASGKAISCTFDPPPAGTRYSYEIKIRTSDGRVLLLDPWVVNN